MNRKENLDNERVHSGFDVDQLINDILNHLGIIIVAEAGHGKSYTAFTIVKEAMKRPDLKVIVFSPSTVWRRRFGSIDCVKVGTEDFNPIIENTSATLEPVPIFRDTIFINLDKHWKYKRSEWLESLLQSKRNILFEIKYRNGRRIKAFESVVLQYVYEMQERRLDAIGDYKQHYLMVFEELQNAFGTYSMNSDDSLELLTVFTQSRSDANIHFIGIGQRLNDISTKIVERLRPFIGLTLGERSLAKIRAMIPKELEQRIQELPSRHYIYLDGKQNPEVTVPEFKRDGHVTYLKPLVETSTKHVYQYQTVGPTRKTGKLKRFLKLLFGIPELHGSPIPTREQEDQEEDDLDFDQECLDSDMK